MDDLEDPAAGFLRRSTVSTNTRLRYESEAKAVATHLGAPLATFQHVRLDALLAEYVEHLFLFGETAAVARYALCGTSFALDLVTRDLQVFPLAKKT